MSGCKKTVGSENIYDNSDIQDQSALRDYIIRNFDCALKHHWIKVYYQPLIRTMTQTVCGAEALVRWIDPQRGVLSPGMFIPALEESGQIYSLDLYVFEQVCRQHRALMDVDEEIIPVSVNLSRKDFTHDNLVKDIDRVSRKYGIPREFTHVEITESAFVENISHVNQHIEAFHKRGYQVWMDDFGSGYSSLGVLQKYSFDVIKIDMSFLRNFNSKSQMIITAIVKMAKEIGIQTLAEGVETEQQFNFLKSIGCEKIQGYYFAKPMPLEETIPFFKTRGLELERAKWTGYFDALSRIDYLTDQSLCVVDDDGICLKFLYYNKKYRDVLKRDHIDDLRDWEIRINTPGDPISIFHRRFADQQLRKLSGTQSIAYPSGDHYMQLTASVAAKKDTHYLYKIHIQYVNIDTEDFDPLKSEAINNLYYLCNDIALYDFEDGCVEGIKSSLSSQPMGVGMCMYNLKSVVETWMRDYCYAPDQKRFKRFADVNTMQSRLRNSKTHILTGLFRSLTCTGEYSWFLHMVIPVQNSNFRKALHVTMESGMSESSVREIVSDLSGIDSGENQNGITSEVLWKNLMANSKEMYFWKDQERKFLGASKSFLQYYGLRSEDELIGKTDEEMMWHIDPMPFLSIEKEILRSGEKMYQVSGKCIVKGEDRDIIASKIPIYRDGKIAGILGSVIDTGEAAEFLGTAGDQIFTDGATGLANRRGFIEGLFSYGTELQTENANFAVIVVNVPEYREVIDLYGDELGDQMLKRIGEKLKEAAGSSAVIGRTGGSTFSIMMSYSTRAEVKELGSSIRRCIEGIGTIGQWKGDCSASITVAYYDRYSQVGRSFLDELNRFLLNRGDREVL